MNETLVYIGGASLLLVLWGHLVYFMKLRYDIRADHQGWKGLLDAVENRLQSVEEVLTVEEKASFKTLAEEAARVAGEAASCKARISSLEEAFEHQIVKIHARIREEQKADRKAKAAETDGAAAAEPAQQDVVQQALAEQARMGLGHYFPPQAPPNGRKQVLKPKGLSPK